MLTIYCIPRRHVTFSAVHLPFIGFFWAPAWRQGAPNAVSNGGRVFTSISINWASFRPRFESDKSDGARTWAERRKGKNSLPFGFRRLFNRQKSRKYARLLARLPLIGL
jgi:hypothetical protein